MTFYNGDQLRNLGQEIANAAEKYISDQDSLQNVTPLSNVPYESYPDLYASYSTPDPADMQSSLNALGNISFILDQQFPFGSPGSDGTPVPQVDSKSLSGLKTPDWIFNDLNANLTDWHGTARDAFQTAVLNGLMDKVGNQKGVARLLAATLASEMNLRNKLNQNVWDVGQATLKTFNQSPLDALKSDQGQYALSIITAFMTSWTVVGAAVTAAKMTANDIASVANGLDTAAINADKAVPKDSIDNRSADTIHTSMMNALKKVAQSYTDQQGQIKQLLDKVNQAMADSSQTQLFQFQLPWTNLDTEELGSADQPQPGTLEYDFRNH